MAKPDALAGEPPEEDRADEEHAVVLHIGPAQSKPSAEDWSIDELEERLEDAVQRAGAGELDGHEARPGWLIIFMYGPDADLLAEAILKPLRTFELPPGSYMIKRYGEPGASEEKVPL